MNTTGGLLVLIVAYRCDEHLRECLRALGDGLAVTVVDNEANATTEEIVTTAGATYVAAPENLGFAGGVNAGLAASWDGAADVLLLNPDARIDRSSVHRLAAALHRDPAPRLAAVGPLLVGTDGHAQAASWPMPSPSQVWLDAAGLGRLWCGRRFVTGAVLLLNGEALAALGGLDERYFLYAEESDWQMRAQRAGWSVAVVPDVTAAHVGGASSSDSLVRDEIFHASARAFALKWYGRLGAAVMRLGSVAAVLRRRLTTSRSA